MDYEKQEIGTQRIDGTNNYRTTVYGSIHKGGVMENIDKIE